MFELFERLKDNHHPDHDEPLHIAIIKPGQQIISKKILGLRRRYPDRHREGLDSAARTSGGKHLAQRRINETDCAKLPDHPQASYEAPRGCAQTCRHEFLHGVHVLHLGPNKENEVLEEYFLRLLCIWRLIRSGRSSHMTPTSSFADDEDPAME